ncbi:MAG: polymer-forming cytoskeletal protein [Alphaproteobacteria bacterium]|nr:polymer-forming cytoskeletal protein [Alphaproteobacteria bacterium]
MFGPKEKNKTDFRDELEEMEDTSIISSPRSDAIPTMPRVGGVPRRLADVGNKRVQAASGEGRKLIVGDGLSLKGEIVSCDILVVAGKVEVTLTDGRLLEIQETGQFKGNVEIENADIAGRYDGDLVVHGRLTIRSTGRVGGRVKYGELEVNVGGQIIGELEVTNGAMSPKTGPVSSFKNATRFSPAVEEDKSKGGQVL